MAAGPPAPRAEVSFLSHGEPIAAWLYRPGGAGPLAPCVVLAHGFGATRAARLDAFAERFAAAGYAALVFDYRHFGDSGGQPRQLLDIGRQLDDWRAAIAFARSLGGIDPAGIVAWGTSFSGGHVATIAAEDHGLAAAISQNPFVDGLPTIRALGLASAVRLTAAGLLDELGRLRGAEPHLIPLVGPPGTTAAMSTPDAVPGYAAMFAPGEPWNNSFSARAGLRIGLYRPSRRAGRITCPWLVQISEQDLITPPAPALAAAARAPRSEVRRYAGGHFEIYVGDGFERSVADQLAFLERAAPAPVNRG
ncbi:MAG: alpha/beta hydrolase [Solirubrobacteraceae bacterium]